MTEVVNPVSPCIICLQVSTGLIQFRGSCRCCPTIHTNCLNSWFETNSRTCPICRVPYEAKVEEQVRDDDCCSCCCAVTLIAFILMGCFLR